MLNIGSGISSLDRVVVREADRALVVALADGAGGMAGGAEAAESLVSAAASWSARAALESDGRTAVVWIESADRAMARARHGGQCTAVIAVLEGDRVAGASVGDSMVWICDERNVVDLTSSQSRKPLVGSGVAIAASFAVRIEAARVLVASDGLWKYADRESIRAAAMTDDLDLAARRLVELVRLPSGALQDDISLALIE